MTGSIRLYVPASLSEGEVIAASPAQAHYLGDVMRRGPGSPLLLFNGRDGEFTATIETIRRDRASLRVGGRTRAQAAGADLWLVFAPLKRDATDLVVQKATELGAAELHPVLTERANTRRVNLERLQAIAIEAAEQCERLTVPRLLPPRSLDALLGDWSAPRRLFAALERSAADRLIPAPGPRALLIGPEGGLAPAERESLLACPFVSPVSLGPLILRSETACIVGLALLQGEDRP